MKIYHVTDDGGNVNEWKPTKAVALKLGRSYKSDGYPTVRVDEVTLSEPLTKAFACRLITGEGIASSEVTVWSA